MTLVSVLSGSKDFTFTKSNAIDSSGDYFVNGVFVYAGYEVDAFRSIGLTHNLDEFYSSTKAVYTSSVDVFTATSSYDRSSVISVLSPSVSSSGPRTLSQLVLGTDSFLTTEQMARKTLSGTL
jgi:hypothetical protein